MFDNLLFLDIVCNKLMCIVDHSYEIVATVPLSSILDVKKFSKKNLPKDKQMFLMDGVEILCSNIQSYRVSSLAFISASRLINNHNKNEKLVNNIPCSYEFMIDDESYAHNLSSCEIKT